MNVIDVIIIIRSLMMIIVLEIKDENSRKRVNR